MVQYSKRTYGCHFLYVTGPNYISFSFGENLGKNLDEIGQKNTLKDHAEVSAQFLNE